MTSSWVTDFQMMNEDLIFELQKLFPPVGSELVNIKELEGG